MIRLVLADDHPVFAAGLRAVLEAEEDMQVTAVAATGRQAVRAVTEDPPDIAVLDLSMPDGDGLWVSAQVRRAGLPTRVLILTMSDEDDNVLAALRAGAQGYAVKGAGPDEIVAAVRAVAHGEAVFGAGIATRMLDYFSRVASAAPFPQLTDREHEVLRLIAGGADNAAVSRRLGVSGKTVRNYVSKHHHQVAGDRPHGGRAQGARRRDRRVWLNVPAQQGQGLVTPGRDNRHPAAHDVHDLH